MGWKYFVQENVKNIKEVDPANSNGCGDTDLIHQTPIPLPEQYANLNNDYADREPSTIEKNNSWTKRL